MKPVLVGILAAVLTATTANAQVGETVTAADPQGMVDALELAGYDAELGVDKEGDPKISIELGGREGRIYFYGCDEQTHDACDAIQFNIGFDRAKPWTASEAILLSTRFRFVAVSLDDEGDPFISWDVITGDGIPTKVFLRTVLSFTDVADDVASVVFAEERQLEGAGD